MSQFHLVTTAFVGGQSGKSTFSMMLAAHLCRPDTRARSVVLVDLSFNSVLYHDVWNIFGQPNEQHVGQHPCFIVNGEASDHDIKFVVVKPENEVADANGTLDFFTEFYSGIGRHISGAPNHILCESNLSYTELSERNFLNLLRGGNDSRTRLNIWTTWLISAIGTRRVYDEYYVLDDALRDKNAFLYLVHNQFAGNLDVPTSVSASMKACHALPLSTSPIDTLELWDLFGADVKGEIQAQTAFEKIWGTAYQPFVEKKECPLNLLPVFVNSNSWRIAALNRFHLRQYQVASPCELGTKIDSFSDNMYSDVFSTYFDKLLQRLNSGHAGRW